MSSPEQQSEAPGQPGVFATTHWSVVVRAPGGDEAGLQHDPNRPEAVLKVAADEDGVGGDDAADVLRYLVATKARAISQRKLRGM